MWRRVEGAERRVLDWRLKSRVNAQAQEQKGGSVVKDNVCMYGGGACFEVGKAIRWTRFSPGLRYISRRASLVHFNSYSRSLCVVA